MNAAEFTGNLPQEARTADASARGQLRIFFGMCPGVGKTYAMLQAAQQRRAEGVDVVVGLVETHGRAETEALLAGLAVLPRRRLDYRGVVLEELDLDGLLSRHPPLALVDELAHTNAPGSRHPKRYQDVLELLDAGIDVYTTLNVQHLESRMDLVGRFTGTVVRETVPDSILDRADDIQLIDLTPELLRQRLADGKVYLGERADAAARNFFREENLTALREMALRCTAEHVDQELRDVMRAKRIEGSWQTGQRLAVAVGPSPSSSFLIRSTRRMAAAMDAPWVAIYVETPRPLTEAEQAQLTRNLSLARHLGAEVVMTRGEDVAEAVLEAAREQRVTQLVVGRPGRRRPWQLFRGGASIGKLLRQGRDIDIHVLHAARESQHPVAPSAGWPGSRPRGRELGIAAAGVAGVTLLSWLLHGPIEYRAIGLLYLLTITVLATYVGRAAVLLAAALSALLWNFLFIPPVFTFHVESWHDGLMLVMYFAVAVAVGRITSRLRGRELAERMRDQRTQALNRLLEGMADSTTLAEGLRRAVAEMDVVFHTRSGVLLTDREGRHLAPTPHPASTFTPSEREFAVAAWAFENRRVAGRFTDTLPDAAAMYLPLVTPSGRTGVIGVQLERRITLPLDERELLETFVAQIATLVERFHLIESASQARVTAESERLHRTLLDSVSHELKTPLAVIEAATDGLDNQLDATRVPLARTFLDEIKQASRRLGRVVGNLLDMTRIETGRLPLNLEWCEPAELLHAAAEQVQNEIPAGRIRLSAPASLPLVRLDPGLMEQALCNLLSNAAAYSPPDAPIRLSAQMDGATLVLQVADRGIGLAPGEEKRVFEKFYRGPQARPGGTGLGLSIVQGFVVVHKGEISAANNADGGATFTLRIPVERGKMAEGEGVQGKIPEGRFQIPDSRGHAPGT
jgi:two-component system sensor histidine kinase KdpD